MGEYKETKLKRKSLYEISASKNYRYMETQPSKVNPIFTESPHYGIPEKEPSHDKRRS